MGAGTLGCRLALDHFKEPFFCALLSFSLNTAAYTAEILAGSIRETNKGEVEAARAMGMGRGS
jgi:arginine/ornithine transport system permease protein